MWGAEANLGDYGRVNAGAGDWKSSGLQVAGTGTFPIVEEFSVIGKLGLARTELQKTANGKDTTSHHLFYGIGVHYTFSKIVALRAQYEGLGTVGDTDTGTTRITLLTVGALYRF